MIFISDISIQATQQVINLTNNAKDEKWVIPDFDEVNKEPETKPSNQVSKDANDIFFVNDEEKDSENKVSDNDTISIDDYELLEKIGKGTFGEVYKAVLKTQKENFKNLKYYAIKRIRKRHLLQSGQMKYAVSEGSIMK